MRRFWLMLFFVGCCGSECSAQVVQLHTSTGKGSAVCVGDADGGGQLFVTVKHNFEVGETGRYIPAGQVVSIRRPYAL